MPWPIERSEKQIVFPINNMRWKFVSWIYYTKQVCQFWKDIYFIMEKILMLYLGYILSKVYPPPPPPPKKNFFSIPGSKFLPSANKCYRLCIA